MTQILIGIIALVAIPILLLWWLKTAADNKQQASFTKQGTIEFVVAGNRLLKLLENIRTHYWNETEYPYKTKVGRQKPDGTWELVTVEIPVSRGMIEGDPNYKHKGYKKFRHYLRAKWGFYWVSILYPLRKIHHFKIPKVRLSRDYKSGHPLEEWIQRDEDLAEVSALQYRVPRPVLVSDIEFKGVLQASVGVVTGIRFVVPEIPVFTYPGEFFQLYEQAVQGATIDYAKNNPLDYFISEMAKGPNSDFFMTVLSRLNVQLPPEIKPDSDGIYRVPKDTPGLISQLGIEIDFGYISAIAQKEDEFQAALKAKELAHLKGEAEVEAREQGAKAARKEAEGQRDAQITVAEGEASAIEKVGQARAEAYRKLVQATGNTPEIVVALLHKEALGAFAEGGGTTLVEGGASAGVIVQTSQKPPPAPPKPNTP